MAMTTQLASQQLLGAPAAFGSEPRFPDTQTLDRDTRPGILTRHPAATPDATN